MADLTITATGVLKTTSTRTDTGGVFGQAVAAGQAVYRKTADGKWWLAQCDGTPEEAGSSKLAVALNGGAADQPATVAVGGDVTLGATVAVGVIYVVSANLGGIAPVADLLTGGRLSILGYGKTTNSLQLDISATGIVKA